MLTVEISLPEVEELQKLVQEGLEKGVLNYDEIASGLDEVELSKEQVEDSQGLGNELDDGFEHVPVWNSRGEEVGELAVEC